jgi:hypothetical protein
MKRSIVVTACLLALFVFSPARSFAGDDEAPTPEKIAKWREKAAGHFKTSFEYYNKRTLVCTKTLKVIKGSLGSSVLGLDICFHHDGTELKYKPKIVTLTFNGYTAGSKLFFQDKSLYFLVNGVQLQAPRYVKYGMSNDGRTELLSFEVTPEFFAQLATGKGSVRGKLAGIEFEIKEFDQVVLQEVNNRITSLPAAPAGVPALPKVVPSPTLTPVVWEAK